ncbi:hypothetical protein ACP70R_041964 [Stipagrostis hirtigluma subsp. patula]
MDYFNTSSDYCSLTLRPYVFNLASSYANQSNEAAMVATSIVMFALAAFFFNLNLFSAFSDISAFLNPSIRLFLSTALSLFLPVMTYLFSEAKNEGAAASGGQIPELSFRARTILTWMLLVELLRKKVEAIAGMQGYSGTIDRAARIAWMGYLVFYNLRSPGKKAFYGTLWVLAAAKLVQRFVTSELAKRSFAYGKNPHLLASYMAMMLQEQHHQEGSSHGSELLKECNYVVLGEEDLEKEAGPDGYHLPSMEAIKKNDFTVVMVGKIWELAETDQLLQSDLKLKRLCLSFALYKLLRRRLEDFVITDTEARHCHDLIFRGLCKETTNEDDNAVSLFQVFNDEVHFLCECYHSVLPVMFASPFFFLINYIMFPILVGALCALTIILGSHGDVAYAFHSFRADNYGITVGLMTIITCLVRKITKSPMALFSAVDVSITFLLALSFAYEQVWEFLVFIFSNWFLVSLLCNYASLPVAESRRARQLLIWVIRAILWVRTNMLGNPNILIKQFSVLRFCRLSSVLPTKATVPKEAKKAIMQRLLKVKEDAAPPSNGMSVLMSEEHHERGAALSWACESASIADVILTWHIATALLEAKHPLPKHTQPGASRKVATAMSGYCAYLVAFHPELLPDDKDGTEHLYKEMKKELKKEMGCWGYYCPPPRDLYDKLMDIAGWRHGEAATPRRKGARWGKLMEVAERDEEPTTVLHKGAKLGKILIDKAAAGDAAREGVWKLLADVWTEVVVYAAPTGSEQHVKAHREALAQGGQFITVLWALATHTGISRGPAVATPAAPHACAV